jgi:hypothetical protein
MELSPLTGNYFYDINYHLNTIYTPADIKKESSKWRTPLLSLFYIYGVFYFSSVTLPW